MTLAARPCLDIPLCAPRGFCAGVVRAMDAVERALALYDPPVYVRHEIDVHADTVSSADETVFFPLPKAPRNDAAA